MQHLAEQLLAQAIGEPGAQPFLPDRHQRLQQAAQQHHYHQYRQPLLQGELHRQLPAGSWGSTEQQ